MAFRITRSAVERVAERQIREAIAAGELDDLRGLGEPIPGIDEPYDPLWWVKGWIARNELEPELRRPLPRRRR
jgi:Domain of unknown function (DUF1992)